MCHTLHHAELFTSSPQLLWCIPNLTSLTLDVQFTGKDTEAQRDIKGLAKGRQQQVQRAGSQPIHDRHVRFGTLSHSPAY